MTIEERLDWLCRLRSEIYVFIPKEWIKPMDEALTDCIKELEEQKPKTRWIPVRDNLPIVGEDVLICDLDGDMYISYLHTDGRWGYDECGNKLKNIIAWQPLPKPYRNED